MRLNPTCTKYTIRELPAAPFNSWEDCESTQRYQTLGQDREHIHIPVRSWICSRLCQSIWIWFWKGLPDFLCLVQPKNEKQRMHIKDSTTKNAQQRTHMCILRETTVNMSRAAYDEKPSITIWNMIASLHCEISLAMEWLGSTARQSHKTNSYVVYGRL